MSKVSIGVFCAAVAYVALVTGLASAIWGESLYRKAFSVMVIAIGLSVACVDWKKVPE